MKAFFRHIVMIILEAEARLVLKKYKPKIIAVTGSVGKTSTTAAVFAVIEKKLVAAKSQKSFNSEFGLPLTILRCDTGWSNPILWLRNIVKGFTLFALRKHYPKWLVLELGAGKPGDILRAVGVASPDVAIITRFGDVPVHVEFFKSPEEVFAEKAELAKALKPTGMLILNADDERVLALRDKTKAKSITYGLSENAMFRATNIQIAYEKDMPIGTTFKFEYDGNVFPVVMHGVLGVQPVYSALAALATGVYLKQNIVEMVSALGGHASPPGRMRIIPGEKECTIIDDTYNSSPVAAHTAIEMLAGLKTHGRKIVVLGDMLELGKFTHEEHAKLGIEVGKFADLLLVVGPRAKYIVEGALDADMSEKNILEFDDSRSAGKYLEGIISAGDVILIKGSQGVRMERAVEEIMADPAHAPEFLVRQEDEWQAKA